MHGSRFVGRVYQLVRRPAAAPIGVSVFVLAALVGFRGAPSSETADSAVHSHAAHAHANMSEAEMERWIRDFYATHPVVGVNLSPLAAADTFRASGFSWDTDGVGGNIDTAFIFTGQSILWRRIDGSHTATNGTGSGDPNAGTLFDAFITLSTPTFQFLFDTPGVYPFFCRPHELSNMRGVVKVTDPAAADTFDAIDIRFDADANASTEVDTAHINAGESVMWRLVSDAHTVTSGTGASDPAAGQLFDVPLDATNKVFVFQFNQAGMFRFFCRPHEAFNMRGVVVVGPPVSVEPPGPGKLLGFLSDPAPNPTGAGVHFRFALQAPGRVTLRVLDSRGRVIAEPLNRQFEAGSFPASWDGKTRSGSLAKAGVYYLRLSLPGWSQTRQVVVAR